MDAGTRLTKRIGEAAGAAREIFELIRRHKTEVMARFLGASPDVTDPAHAPARDGKWPLFPLREIALIVHGDLRAEDDRRGPEPGSVLIAVPSCVSSLRFSDDACATVDPSHIAPGTPRAEAGDIVVACAGDHPGASAILPLDHAPIALGSGCAAVRADGGRCDQFYLLNVLHFFHTTGRMPSTRDDLASLRVPLPPHDEQRRITHYLLELSGGMVAQERHEDSLARLAALVRDAEAVLRG